VRRGFTCSLTYDIGNRLTTVSGAASATFVYDGDGNRVKATLGSVTAVYVGNHYEKEGSRDARVSMRVDDGSGDVGITKAAKGVKSPTGV
jgi:hypothetical protein